MALRHRLPYLAVALVAILTVAGCFGTGGTNSSVTTAQRAAITTILAARAAGVQQHDQQKFLTGLAADNGNLVAAQQGVYANLLQLPIASWSYSLANTQVAASAAGITITAEVILSYQLAGFDAVPDSHRITMTFVDHGGTVSLREPNAGSAQSWRGIWDDGPIAVVVGSSCLVITAQSVAASIGDLTSQCDAAVAAVTAVWGTGWPQRAVLLVPAALNDLRGLGAGGRNLQSLSALAVATSADVSSGRVSGARILVNAQSIQTASPIARQVLLSHEMTHIAARAVTRAGTPLWLQEGFADFVGYQAAGIDPPNATAAAAEQLASDPPTELPADGQFTGSGSIQQAAYEYAWLALRLLASEVGQPQVAPLYRQVAMSSDPEATFNAWLQAHLAMTRAEFVSAWISYLKANIA